MSAPEKLRTELERLRDRGLSFKAAWPVAMSDALRGESMTSAIFWRETWAAQRGVWACSYSRVLWPAKERPALFFRDEDYSIPAARVRPSVVS